MIGRNRLIYPSWLKVIRRLGLLLFWADVYLLEPEGFVFMTDNHGAVQPILNHQLLSPHVIEDLVELPIMSDRKVVPERSSGLDTEDPIEIHTVGYRTVEIIDLTGFYSKSFGVLR